MRRRWLISTAALLAMTTTGLAAYFLTPIGGSESAFLLGFLCALTLLSIGILLFLPQKTESGELASGSDPTRKVLTAFLILTGGLLGGFLIYQLNAWMELRQSEQEQHRSHQAAMLESSRINGLMPLMSDVLDQVDQELRTSENRSLSEETIARIVALSRTLGPDSYLKEGYIPTHKQSRERGLLLQSLARMAIDTGSMHEIMQEGIFAGADLSEAPLQDAYLRGADLRWANFRGAELKGAILSGADLLSVDMRGANLSSTDLSQARMGKAQLDWAVLDSACLTGADLRGAVLQSAQLRQADLSGAKLQTSDLRWANLSGADARLAYFESTLMSNAQLVNTNFAGAKLRWTSLRDSDMTGANLSGTLVGSPDWPEKILSWDVEGAEDIHQKYVTEDAGMMGEVFFRMRKKRMEPSE